MKLYYTEASPPCRTILLLAELLNIKLELVLTSPKKGETQTATYLEVSLCTRMGLGEISVLKTSLTFSYLREEMKK